jgi:hypothetical protein
MTGDAFQYWMALTSADARDNCEYLSSNQACNASSNGTARRRRSRWRSSAHSPRIPCSILYSWFIWLGNARAASARGSYAQHARAISQRVLYQAHRLSKPFACTPGSLVEVSGIRSASVQSERGWSAHAVLRRVGQGHGLQRDTVYRSGERTTIERGAPSRGIWMVLLPGTSASKDRSRDRQPVSPAHDGFALYSARQYADGVRTEIRRTSAAA